MPSVRVEFDERELRALRNVTPAVKRAMRKAWATALRDMRSEASKRIRARKRIKARFVHRALIIRRPSGDPTEAIAGVDVRGEPVPMTAYPVRRVRQGVSAEINRGKRSLVKSAFLATMASGHRGVFVRRGAKRLPIDEVFTSRPVDPLLDDGVAEAVGQRGAASLVSTFARLLPGVLAKEGGGSGGA